MPSLKCYQCGKVKRCSMHQEADRENDLTVSLVYLCRPCARALGYLQSTPNPEEN
jgi:hypothetical protein